jgi:hypothetical protein
VFDVSRHRVFSNWASAAEFVTARPACRGVIHIFAFFILVLSRIVWLATLLGREVSYVA